MTTDRLEAEPKAERWQIDNIIRLIDSENTPDSHKVLSRVISNQLTQD